MKLVKKRTVFISSADGVGGDRGSFNVQMPVDFVFDEKLMFKLFITQANIRNSFAWVTDPNSGYLAALGNPGNGVPPDASFQQFHLPLGFPSIDEIAASVQNDIGELMANLPVAQQRDMTVSPFLGRLYFNQADDNGAQPTVNLYFRFTNQAADIMGFNGLGTHLITPNNAPADPGPVNPPFGCTSDRLANVDHIQNILVKTSIPSDNYSLGGEGPAANGVTIQIPVGVPPGGAIIYTDHRGVHAAYEQGRSVVNNLSVELLDEHYNKLIPDQHWSFVLTIEQWEDQQKEVVQLLQSQKKNEEEMIQLLKMLLLQREFKKGK